MANITMSLDEELIKKIRKIALERGTSLTGLVREYLVDLAYQDEVRKKVVIRRLKKIYDLHPLNVGEKNWDRASLHER